MTPMASKLTVNPLIATTSSSSLVLVSASPACVRWIRTTRPMTKPWSPESIRIGRRRPSAVSSAARAGSGGLSFAVRRELGSAVGPGNGNTGLSACSMTGA